VGAAYSRRESEGRIVGCLSESNRMAHSAGTLYFLWIAYDRIEIEEEYSGASNKSGGIQWIKLYTLTKSKT
jgi:hypothetical protein